MRKYSKSLLILSAFFLASCGCSPASPAETTSKPEGTSITSEETSSSQEAVSSPLSSESIQSSESSKQQESSQDIHSSAQEVSSAGQQESDEPEASSDQPSSQETTSISIDPPVGDLVLLGIEEKDVIKGHYFDPLEGVSIQGDNGTGKIEVSGYVDYGKTGSYVLTYEAQDERGSVRASRVINVKTGTYTHPVLNRSRGADRKVALGSGSYRTGNVPEGAAGDGNQFHLAPMATNVDTEVLNRGMLPSNQWWTGFAYSNFGGVTLGQINPLSFGYTANGLHVTNRGEGFTQYFEVADTYGTQQTTMSNFTPTFQDVFVKPGSLGANPVTSVIDYDDVSVKIAMRNSVGGEDEMVSTFVQGSPFIVSEFKNPTDVKLSLRIPAVTKPYQFFDKDGNQINGSNYTGDGFIICLPQAHYGYETSYPSTAVGAALYQDVYYYVSLPEGSSVTFAQGAHPSSDFKDSIQISMSNGNALGIAGAPNLEIAKKYAKSGQSFVFEGKYDYQLKSNNTAKTTSFHYGVRHFGEKKTPLLSLLPHQWKNLASDQASLGSLVTKRGTTKLYEGSSFEMMTPFYGLAPSFAGLSTSLPNMESYLNTIVSHTVPGNVSFSWQDSDKNYYNAPGPYWCSKALYPLGQGLIIADQLGMTTLKNTFKERLKALLVDWFTYDGNGDARWLYYDEAVGSMYYSVDNFSTNSRLSDHHFTSGYLINAAAILAMYDTSFISQYGQIAKMLLLDYMNYEKNAAYPSFRGFDVYDGHSWADGLGNFGDGNDQESCGEALNSWASAYFLGAALGETEMMDAASWGFSLELESIKQYWFNYDEDNWISSLADYTHALGIVWGAKNDYATWFGSNPEFIYGIHYLPTGEYLSSYAYGDQEKAVLKKIYQEFLTKVGGAPRTWQSNMWAIQAVSDPATAVSNFDGNKILLDTYADEAAGSYYMVNALNELGQKATNVQVLNQDVVATVYRNGTNLKLMVWNPSNEAKTVQYLVDMAKSTKNIPANSFVTVSL